MQQIILNKTHSILTSKLKNNHNPNLMYLVSIE